ncbi:MAG: LacI family DNA-binding transcriptional regulator [Spirochaetes bacterium]|nr:LacI family DNA-binding transcriptional regulator [Spirochaetota bacterium]
MSSSTMAKKTSRARTPDDIAALARHFGLSRSAVSYILNGKWVQRRIGAATAAKVLDYIKETGFQPNILGLALRGKTVKEIAIVLPTEPYDHHKEAYFRLLKSLEARGRTYVVLPTTDAQLPETVRFLKMYRVKQLVIFAAGMDAVHRKAWLDFLGNTAAIPAILYDFPFEALDAGPFLEGGDRVAIGIDRAEARSLVLSALVAKGYRRLLLPQSWFDRQRTQIPPGIESVPYSLPVRVEGDTLAAWGDRLAETLQGALGDGTPLVAFVPDDKLSWAAIHSLRRKGVCVPQDLSLCSWDGLEESAFFSPSLATLAIPHAPMLAAVVDWLGGAPMGPRIKLKAHLREGDSLPPAGGDPPAAKGGSNQGRISGGRMP